MDNTLPLTEKNIIEKLESLKIPSGPHRGKPFPVLEWQKKIIRFIADPDSDTLFLSIARGSGKSAFCGTLGYALFTWFMGESESITIVASDAKQARILFGDICYHDNGSFKNNKGRHAEYSFSSKGRVEHLRTGKIIEIVAGTPSGTVALRSSLILCDEPSSWEKNTRDEVFSNLQTGMGKQNLAKMICLGTSPPAHENHWFTKGLDGKLGIDCVLNFKGKSEKITQKNIDLANPSMVERPDLFETTIKKINSERKRASNDELLMDSFLADRCNLPISTTRTKSVIPVSRWKAVEVDAIPEDLKDSRFLCLGIDLGGVVSLTAISCMMLRPNGEKFLINKGFFPKNIPLAERQKKDGVGRLYTDSLKRGELVETEGVTSNIPEVLNYVWNKYGVPERIVADNYHQWELREALENINFPMTELVIRVGHGWGDSVRDLQSMERAIFEKTFKTPASALVRSSFAAAESEEDTSGNKRLMKRGSRCRDDIVSSICFCLSHCPEVEKKNDVEFQLYF